MNLIVLLSGKRKSGKDYVAERLKKDLQVLGCTVAICRLSEPLKREYSELNSLNFHELLTDGEYKEKFRQEMVVWGEQIREKDPGYFARGALKGVEEGVEICIVADCRRPSDLDFFRDNYSDTNIEIVKIRIHSDQESRSKRGWKFVKGVDDAETECALDDDKNFDFILTNNDSEKEKFENNLTQLKHNLFNKFKYLFK